MGVCVHVSHQYFRSVYVFQLSLKMGRRQLGRGMWDVGTQGREDVGREHARRIEDVGHRDWRI